ncbi:TPR_REGION domain-containing protein [Trichoderma simmonsii]|uniref:TPR_REGION domain-containing protein n=1 Tax=Trichoderma simmonsii TaxID=1491479 RepID=A0A8G0PQJ6_9HYPO|nr:TPR_REGION domain-containing protein [Trichoderma simmonsii]
MHSVATLTNSCPSLAAYSRDILEAIGQNTRTLLNIASQMKRIIRAIEAIPLHLTLDIVRLDDALGESWALPIQACQNWKSFHNLLSAVIYTRDRPGMNRIHSMHLTLTMANGGIELGEFNWARAIKPGLHVEQAIVVTRADASVEACLECSNVNSNKSAKHPDKPCSTCGRWVGRQKCIVEPVVRLLDTSNTLTDETPPVGPELPSMQPDIDSHYFRRVQIRERSEPIHDINTAKTILSTDHMDPAANTFVALRLIQDAQDSENLALLETSTRHLEIAISSDGTAVDPGYLLAEISMLRQDYRKAYDYFRQVMFRKPRSPQIWISIAILCYHIDQFRDSIDALSRALRLNMNIDLSWYNLGVLYDANNQAGDAYDAFQRCLELNPHLPDVQARFDVLADFRKDETNAPDDHRIKKMLQCDLIPMVDESDNIGDAEIELNPITGAKNSEQRAR